MEKICKTTGIYMRKVIDKFGNVFYFNENNEFHREDGPAMEHADGIKFWFRNNSYHREDGPAIEYADGEKEYWYNGVEYQEIKTDEEWKRFVKLIIFI